MLRKAAQSLLALPLASPSVSTSVPCMVAAARTTAPGVLQHRSYATQGAGAVVELQKEEDFNALKSYAGLAVVDFTAKWCGPCKAIAPVYEQLAKEHPTVKFVKVDIDNPSVRKAVEAHQIASVPTFVFYKSGKQVAGFSGADRNQLVQLVAQHK